MKTKFIISGSSVHIFKMNTDTALDILPPRVYTAKFSQCAGFYLEITKDKLELPTKIYGTMLKRVDKCLRTYKDRTTSTGILLTGDKGTGKTLLMSLLANDVIEKLGVPVILIKEPFAGTDFVSFIESIGECCLVFDEFGKMYAANDRHINDGDVPQKALLSLLDGVDKMKRMVIITENSELDINESMLSRPSRMYYHFKYRKLDEDSITGYCADYNISKDFIKSMIELTRRSRIFSFDMLQSIVEEHLRFGSDIEEITKDLNIDTREELGAMIEIIKIIERGTEEVKEIYETPFVSKPDNNYVYIKIKTDYVATGRPAVTGKKLTAVDEDELYDEIYIRNSDLAYEKDNKLIYEIEKYIIVAKDVPAPQRNYWNLV